MLRRGNDVHQQARPLRCGGRQPSVWLPESATARCELVSPAVAQIENDQAPFICTTAPDLLPAVLDVYVAVSQVG